METGFGCLAWVIRLIAWIFIGFLTYNWMEPESFMNVLGWLIIWHIATGVASWILFLVVIAVLSATKF